MTDALSGKERESSIVFSVSHVHMCVLCLCRSHERQKISQTEIYKERKIRKWDSINKNLTYWPVLKNVLYFRRNTERLGGDR